MEMLARLENTTLSIWFRESGVAFFTSLTLHSIAMAFVIGVNFAIAFRLVRAVPEFELKPFLKFYKLYWLSVVVIFLSGCALLLAYPAKALTNPIFYIKFSLLTIGLIISWWLQNQMQIIKNNEFSRDKYFWIAMISVFIWIGTITTGRFLDFFKALTL